MIIKKLQEEGLINPPSFLPTNVLCLNMTGSISYGCNTDDSDLDIVGVCIPPKEYLFPSLYGQVQGFDEPKVFNQWQEHHVQHKEKEYDFSVYNIAKYFRLVIDGNPNMVDSLFVPRECVIFSTKLWETVRENRKLFLSKKLWPKCKGYAFSQMQKMSSNKREGKRKALHDKYGYDTKFASHCVRLLLQVEQVMAEKDLDLQRNKEQLKSIRRGEWSEQRVKDWFASKEKSLEKLYIESDLPYSPNEEEIKDLLMQCLRMHYGDLGIRPSNDADNIIRDLTNLVEKYR